MGSRPSKCRTRMVRSEEKPLRVERIDAGNIADIEEINALYSEHQVKPEERRVPIVLYDGGYFVGYENIQKNLINALKNGNLSYNDQAYTYIYWNPSRGPICFG